MRGASRATILVFGSLSAACHCAQAVEMDTGSSTTSSDPSTGASSSTSESSTSTGDPFDASRWIGRYHFENPFLPFGELGDPLGERVLANFEVFADSTASLFYDDCDSPEPLVDEYRWEPDEQGWLSLFPGEGESSLRLVALEDLETLRVRLDEPCRDLAFEADGTIVPWFSFRPGESCWVVRCTVPNLMQVDYCEGEEPPPCP
jgi:hypothetical protein